MATKLEAARNLDARLKGLARRAREAEAALAIGLLEMEESGLFREFGFPRVGDYADVELDVSPGKARALIDLARKLPGLPGLAEAFRRGEIPWTKARTIARVATVETESYWLERARCGTNRDLEREVAEAKGERPKVRLVVELGEEEMEVLEMAVARLREERGEAVPLGEAVVELARRGAMVVGGASRDAGRELPPEVEDDDVKRIPRPVRRHVRARDGCRCRLCARFAWLHIHHLRPWKEGGSSCDPENLVVLCSQCHKRIVHRRKLVLQGTASRLEVRLADGSKAPRVVRARAGARAGSRVLKAAGMRKARRSARSTSMARSARRGSSPLARSGARCARA